MRDEDIVCVLLHGASGSGKSETAKGIAAQGGVVSPKTFGDCVIYSDVKVLASPLIEMHSVKVNTTGPNFENRQLWLLHQVCLDLFPPFSVGFGDLMELIYDIQAYPLQYTYGKNETIVRDRDFMTYIADACHALYLNPFAELVGKKMKKESQQVFNTLDSNSTGPKRYVVIIPDLRLRSELEYFKNNFDNVLTIKLDIAPEEQKRRLLARDNLVLTDEQRVHPTQLSPFDNEEFDLIVRSDILELDDQISMVKDYIFQGIPTGATV